MYMAVSVMVVWGRVRPATLHNPIRSIDEFLEFRCWTQVYRQKHHFLTAIKSDIGNVQYNCFKHLWPIKLSLSNYISINFNKVVLRGNPGVYENRTTSITEKYLHTQKTLKPFIQSIS